MVSKEKILTYLASRKAAFYEEFRVTKLGLFGSFAIDKQTEESDMDILVEFEPATPNLHEKKNKLRSLLSKEFEKEVDLCREKFIKSYFKDQILKTAIYV